MSCEQSLWRRLSCLLAVLVLLQSGCSLCESLRGIPAVPAHRVPAEYLGRPRLEMQDISMTRLRQNPPAVYQLGPGDILGVYIETVIGDSDEPLPVHFHEDGGRPPAVGYPIPVREDGTIDVPYVAPIHVTGLTLTQTTEAIRRAYTDDRSILPKGKDRIIVTLMRRRTYQVLVVREESGAQEGVTKRGTGHVENLPAYENDLLHALNATGGMPGLDAVNEVLIFHGMFADGAMRDHLLAAIQTGRYVCPDDPSMLDDPSIVRIPLRFYPEEVPEFTQEDIILRTGDIVLIKARDREKFYTGGAIPGGEHLLPRDYDLDVLGAIALAGGPLGNSGIGLANGGGNGFGGNRGYFGLSPSRAIVVRKLACSSQVPIRGLANQDRQQIVDVAKGGVAAAGVLEYWSVGVRKLTTTTPSIQYSINPILHQSDWRPLPRSGHFFRAKSRKKRRPLPVKSCAKWQELFGASRFST